MLKRLLFGFVLALGIGSASSAPITFIHTGLGSGTLAGVGFADATFTITSVGDTSARQNFIGGFFIDHITSTIDIAGVGVLTFTTGTRTFVNTGGQIVGFSRAGIGGADLYNGPVNAAFAAWDMLTSIGPIGGIISLLQWDNSPVQTNAGVLEFRDQSVSGTFQAIVGQVPEPATILLLALGLLLGSFAGRYGLKS